MNISIVRESSHNLSDLEMLKNYFKNFLELRQSQVVVGTPYLCGRDRLTGRGGREAAHLIGSTGGRVR